MRCWASHLALLVTCAYAAIPQPDTNFHGCPDGMVELYFDSFETAYQTGEVNGEWDREMNSLLYVGHDSKVYVGGHQGDANTEALSGEYGFSMGLRDLPQLNEVLVEYMWVPEGAWDGGVEDSDEYWRPDVAGAELYMGPDPGERFPNVSMFSIDRFVSSFANGNQPACWPNEYPCPDNAGAHPVENVFGGHWSGIGSTLGNYWDVEPAYLMKLSGPVEEGHNTLAIRWFDFGIDRADVQGWYIDFVHVCGVLAEEPVAFTPWPAVIGGAAALIAGVALGQVAPGLAKPPGPTVPSTEAMSKSGAAMGSSTAPPAAPAAPNAASAASTPTPAPAPSASAKSGPTKAGGKKGPRKGSPMKSRNRKRSETVEGKGSPKKGNSPKKGRSRSNSKVGAPTPTEQSEDFKAMMAGLGMPTKKEG